MSLLQLLVKNLRQRALSSVLTMLSIALGTALGVALLIAGREAPRLFGQAEFGFDLVVSGKGDPLQAVLNNVYLLGQPPPTFDYRVIRDLRQDPELSPLVTWAVPLAWSDTHRGRRILGTTADFFTTFEPRLNRPLQFAQGRVFEPARWQAVLGSDAAAELDIGLGYSFQAFHGDEATGHLHEEAWQVVGVLAPTNTALDRAIFVPLATQLAIGEHGTGVLDQQRQRLTPADISSLYATHQQTLDDLVTAGGSAKSTYVETAAGEVVPFLPPELWRVSGAFVRTSGAFATGKLRFRLNNGPDAAAARPAAVMLDFYDTFLPGPTALLFAVTVGVTVVAAISVLVGIYNSVQGRRREIAVLRSLGATRAKLLTLVTLEAVVLGIVGAALGWLGGHALAAAGSGYLSGLLGEGIAWWRVGTNEILYCLGVVLLSGLAGLVPASAAYRTPVAQHLSE
jgi:putative ABC transport system permease protein